MSKIFDRVALQKPKRSKFDIGHEFKFTMNMGPLVPILCKEIMPGDRFRVRAESFVRLAPMLAPVMHRVNVFIHYFFVPNRLIWSAWESFITGGRTGVDTPPVAPFLSMLDIQGFSPDYLTKGSLLNYLGVPIVNGTIDPTRSQNLSALPMRAYLKVWDDYFRDPNLVPSMWEDTGLATALMGSGDLGAATGADELLLLRQRAWQKDYFTSALPFPQRGADVSLPIEMDGSDITYKDASDVLDAVSGVPPTGDLPLHSGTTAPDPGKMAAGSPGSSVRVENIEDITSTSVTITALRRAVALQKWFEKMAVGGYRYVEQMLAMFAVRSSDARLQRPEYLGGGRMPVAISEVVSTFQSDTSDPQGNMSGHGVSAGAQAGFNSKFFEEHGFLIGVMSVLPTTAYSQGLEKMWTRVDKFDYPWPDFAHIGEQEILKRELYGDYEGLDPGYSPNTVFGYQQRYADLKYQCDRVAGDFSPGESLDFWTMSRQFDNGPLLNQSFVEADPTHRIFAVDDPTVHKLWCQVYQKIDAVRPLPYFSTPRLVG